MHGTPVLPKIISLVDTFHLSFSCLPVDTWHQTPPPPLSLIVPCFYVSCPPLLCHLVFNYLNFRRKVLHFKNSLNFILLKGSSLCLLHMIFTFLGHSFLLGHLRTRIASPSPKANGRQVSLCGKPFFITQDLYFRLLPEGLC